MAVKCAVLAGVAFAAWQVLVARAQTRANFEQLFVLHYRRIVASIPLEAFLGDQVVYNPASGVGADLAIRRAFYDYFELCEDEFFYAKGRLGPCSRRIGRRTWRDWEAGMRGHLALPAFAVAWTDISRCLPEDRFELLRDFISELPARSDKQREIRRAA